MLHVGIVGSRDLTAAQYAAAEILVRSLVWYHVTTEGDAYDVKVVSGGADGLDTIAQQYGEDMCDTLIFHPKNPRWEPDGFKNRNIKIAEASDILYCIRSRQSKTNGSGWTADYAEEALGKEVVRYWV